MIELQVVLVSDFIHVAINPEKSYLEVTWLKQHTGAVYRQEISELVHYITHQGLTRVLYNLQQRAYLELADQNWVIKEVVPVLKELDLRLAYVVNPLTLGVMDLSRVQDAMTTNPYGKKKLQVEMFLTKDLAIEWLLE